jgi:Protein of unknown function (DUF2867)
VTRLRPEQHTAREWRIHDLAPDFHLEDVWALPTPGGPDLLPELLDAFFASHREHQTSRLVRVLWRSRWRLGAVLGWDTPANGFGGRVESLRARLPAGLTTAARDASSKPFEVIYRLGDEWAGEIANETVHAVLHLSWVSDVTAGVHRGQMAVLVKPNGWRGRIYMAAIRPIRHRVVYPAMLQRLALEWRERHGPSMPSGGKTRQRSYGSGK